MRILWFTNTPSRYADYGGHNGGGWIYSLEEEMSKVDGIDLGVAFFMNGQPVKVEKNGVTYYPIESLFSTSVVGKIKGFLSSQEAFETLWIKRFVHVIEDFKPDIIEVFGSEQSFGQISQYTDIPIVLHIQGILTPYYNAFFPPAISKHNYVWQDINPLKVYRRLRWITNFCKGSKREIDIIKHLKFFLGRTEWDKRLTLLYNPNAKYFYGSEILRDVFYEPAKRQLPEKTKIVSTLSSPLYKGYETLLKTAKLLTDEIGLDFEWKIYGTIDPRFVERKFHIYHDDVNIKFLGVATAEQIKQELCSSTVYVHLSYIDNSPNSVCEAQITGVPVVVSNVGGVPSLVKDGNTGFLVPANDPYQTAYIINMLATNKALNILIGHNAHEVANKRHEKSAIIRSLIETYNTIIHDSKNSK